MRQMLILSILVSLLLTNGCEKKEERFTQTLPQKIETDPLLKETLPPVDDRHDTPQAEDKNDTNDTQQPLRRIVDDNNNHLPPFWAIKLKVETVDKPYRIFSGAQLGIVEDGTDATGRTLDAFTNPSARLDVVFATAERNVSTLFFEQSKTRPRWPFYIKSSDPNATVTVRWSLVQLKPTYDTSGRKHYEELPLLKASYLRYTGLQDVQTGATIPADQESYTFHMNGSRIRKFIWIKQNQPLVFQKGNVFVTFSTKQPVTHKPENRETFDLRHPPLFRSKR